MPIPKNEISDIPVLLPSDLLSWMYSQHRPQFMKRIVGSWDGSSLVRFWRSSRSDDELIWNHPALSGATSDSQLRCIVPWANHGDGVPFTRPGAGSVSLQVMSSNSLTGVGSSLDSHFLFAGIPSSIAVKKQPRGYLTMDPLHKVYIWDMRSLASGVHADKDENNQPFPEGS